MSEPVLTITVQLDPHAPPQFQYCAALDDDFEPGRPVGRGATKRAAVLDLMESAEEFSGE